jgi:hypothetical protein
LSGTIEEAKYRNIHQIDIVCSKIKCYGINCEKTLENKEGAIKKGQSRELAT